MYTFLYDNFGKKTVSGIMTGDMGGANGDVRQHADVKAVYQVSGRYPALVGFDFMNATGINENDSWFKSYTRSSVNLAKDTYRRGGLPAFTWHWRDPSRKTGEFYTSGCTMRISDALKADGSWNTSSALYKLIVKDIDATFDKLKTLTQGRKIIALSENGPIPDIDLEFEEEAVWSWWMPWYQTWDGKFVDKTSKAEWTKCMTDERVVTLEDRAGGWNSYTGISLPAIAGEASRPMYYDLQGRRLSTPPTRGIYLRDGKKVIAP